MRRKQKDAVRLIPLEDRPGPNPRAFATPGPWEDLQSRFRWDIPAFFSIAEACCDAWARAAPDRVALTEPGGTKREWSYGDLKAASDRLANALRARGIGRGDRVAILLPQCAEVLITHFAVMKLGAVVLPLFTLFGVEALRFRLEDSGAAALVTDPENLEKAMALVPDLPEMRLVLVTDRAPSSATAFWATIEAASAAFLPAPIAADDPAMLIYTSGTTGPPKGALHAHRFLIGHLPSVELQHEFLPRRGDCGWTPADWAWIGGLMDLAMPCLYHGVRLVAHRMRKFDPEAAYDLIAQERVRNLFLPPTALKLMRQAALPAGIDIRSIASGGESLGADLLTWGRDVLGAPINEIYGQTECNLVVSTCHGAMQVRPGTMGKAVPGHEVAILDTHGKPVAPGRPGEICVRMPDPVMFLGYWNRPEDTSEKVRDGWLRTGDLGSCDEEGYFTFQSRDDDVINSAGYRIGPNEIENCLLGDRDVTMSAVIGVPDPVRGEVIVAYVVIRDDAERRGLEDRLAGRVREKLSPHMAPRQVRVVESLPMTATGKIMRRALRERDD